MRAIEMDDDESAARQYQDLTKFQIQIYIQTGQTRNILKSNTAYPHILQKSMKMSTKSSVGERDFLK
jgi:hypothetical protein